MSNWPGTNIPRTQNNGFTNGYSTPIDWKPLQDLERRRKAATKGVDKRQERLKKEERDRIDGTEK